MSIFRNSRYSTVREVTPIVNRPDNRTRQLLHNRRVFRKDEIKENFEYYTVQSGDLIDLISYIFYRDETLWWYIADVNELLYAWDLYPGQILVIPHKNLINGSIGV